MQTVVVTVQTFQCFLYFISLQLLICSNFALLQGCLMDQKQQKQE